MKGEVMKKVGKIVLNDKGWELVKQYPSTSNEWSKREMEYIKILLSSGKDYLEGNSNADGIETAYFIKK